MITIEHLAKSYPDSAHCDLYIPSLTIPDGEVVGVLGANGAGKSTLLRAIMGLTNAGDPRAVQIDGRLPQACYDELSYMTEAGSFPPFLSPSAYGVFQADLYPGFDRARYEKLLSFFQLPTDRPARTFSNGQRAKLEVAAGFSRGARYLLLDEPFLGKDIFTRRDFLKLMAGSLHHGETILVATHQVDEIENFLDRAILLHEGEVRADVYLDGLRAQGRTLVGLMQEIAGYDPARWRNFTG
ncbi:ABC transporter ATP-binding protein [Intestinibacillus massiliensis]|nr:ABC transporter ATP-binding protein [Intestinibacillus massiliensis]